MTGDSQTTRPWEMLLCDRPHRVGIEDKAMTNQTTPGGAQLAAQGMMNQDPLDMPLPCDIRVHGMCFSRGVKLRVFVEAAARWKVLADKHVAGDLKVPKSLSEIFGPGVPHDY